MKSGDILELEVESIAFGGAGVAKFLAKGTDGAEDRKFAIFLEGTVPGDLVRARIGGKKKNYAFGYVLEFLKKSPARIEPKCRFFEQCGGCAMQFSTYEDQLKIKEQQVRDAVTRIGGFDGGIVLPIVGCEQAWFYRNKMEFSFSKDKDGTLNFGLHQRRRHHDVIELTECFLMEDFIGELVTKVRDFFRDLQKKGKLKTKGAENGLCGLQSMVVRIGKNTGEIMVNLIVENSDAKFSEDFKNLILDFFTKLPDNKTKGVSKNDADLSQKLVSIYLTNIINKKGQPKTMEETVLWGSPIFNERLKLENGSNLNFEISPQAFFQPNTWQAQTLYNLALEAAGLSGKEIVFDLFCGTGTIGIFCAQNAKKVYGIELNESAVKNARINAELNHVKNIEFLVGDVMKFLNSDQNKAKGILKDSPDVVIVDPPRNGLEPKVVEQVAKFGAAKIVYVSCNPTTLARDLSLFKKNGYTVLAVQPVDMLPQTYHIECVATLAPA